MNNKGFYPFLMQITMGFVAASAFTLSALPSVWAQHQHHQTAASVASDAWADAEVRKVDAEARKVTLKHGEIKSLDMPPMTMVFQVDDPSLFKGLNVGERIGFKATHEQGRYVLTAWQKKP